MLSKKLLKKMAIVMFGNVSSQIFAFLFMILASWSLSKGDYGYMSYIVRVGLFFAVLVSGGIPKSITRYIARHKDKELKSEFAMGALIINLVIFGVVALPVLIMFWPNVVIVAIIFFYMLVMFFMSVLRGLQRFTDFAIANMSRNLIKIILIVFVIYAGWKSANIFLWIYAAAGALVILLIEIFRPLKIFKLIRPSKEIIKTILKFSIPVMITTTSVSFINSVGVMIIQPLYGYVDVATFQNALLLVVIYTFIPNAFTVILMPKIAASEDPKKAIKYIRSSLIFSTLLNFLVFVLLVVFGERAIIMLFGTRYSDVYQVAVVLSIGSIFLGIRNIFSALWEGSGRPKLTTIDTLVAATSVAVLSIILIPMIGVVGAAWAYSAGFVLSVCVDVFFFIYLKNKGVFSSMQGFHL